jgi:hypothetical protein
LKPGDASPPRRGCLVEADPGGGRDRHPDDRSYAAEQRTEDEDADDDREAGNIGGLSDDRRLEDLLVLPAGGLGDIVDRRRLLLISESIMFVAPASTCRVRLARRSPAS